MPEQQSVAIRLLKELSPDNKSYFPATENSRQGLVSFSTRYKRTAIRFFNFYNREI